ncbi:IMP dehydrogenase [Paraburkholderia dipogonis]|uniref:Inosine-5'-monophosphate dehydrogenase n=1 Tax=Paraburkholderia dipogonis TaxID=1211383 RepID=A0A4Y8MYK8_9BURK|nr:IMP dehydrogenase [Paraburkholderia dipogonis]TFE42383.1 IMP dehydrogenase [Paraburkholderia dipogonis]
MKLTQQALTFDDVLLVPRYSEVLPREVDLSTKVSRRIRLSLPFLSAAMDTVTESRLAIAMAQLGGIGIVHKNLSPEQQAAEVRKVKRYEAGLVRDPVTVDSKTSVAEVRELTVRLGVSGFPVVDGGRLLGMVTNRDLRFASADQLVLSVMTPRERLVTVKEAEVGEKARILMHEHRLERVLVVSSEFELRGLVTAKDLSRKADFPGATKDCEGKLRVGAAVGVSEADIERVDLLVKAGVDLVVIDTAHGHSKGVMDRLRWVKSQYTDIDVVAGNVATAVAAKALVDAGADGIKVGIGPGSICTTRVVAGVGVPQVTAVSWAADAIRGSGVPVISDGGVRYSGDASKALAAGADAVMMGGLLAGTEESPGEVFLYEGRQFKSYRGMGSIGAMKEGSADRYFQDNSANLDKLVPEGIEARVAYKGPLAPIIFQMAGGLRASMGYCGCETVQIFQENAEFVQITGAGLRESHVHDVQITKEAPNYQLG